MEAFNLKRMVAKLMREVADKIDGGNCEMSDAEAMEILNVLSHQTMSKEDACLYLNLSRSRFDDLVRDNRLPKGRKRRGFKELVWYRDELDAYLWRSSKAKQS